MVQCSLVAGPPSRRRTTADVMHLCDKALASTSEAIVITDPSLPDNPIVYCNDGFEKLTGDTPGLPVPWTPPLRWGAPDTDLLLDAARCVASNVVMLPRPVSMRSLSTWCAVLRCAGYSKAEVTGRSCRFLQDPETSPAAVAELQQAMQQWHPVVVDLVNYRKDGSRVWNQAGARQKKK
jgi:PAS domain-containing protein